MTPGDVARVQELIRRESRSLLQYSSESYPWSGSRDKDVGAAIGSMARDEAAAVARVARWLAKQHAPVTFPGAYPMGFTTANFVAARYLLPRLADDQRRRLAAVAELHSALPEGEGRAALDALAEVMRANLRELQSLQTPAPALAG